MRNFFVLSVWALLAFGCGDKDKDKGSTDSGTEEQGEDAHAHAAKHGGTLLELGVHAGFLEVMMDHDKGSVTVWAYLGEEMKDTKPGKAPLMNFLSEGKPMQLTATANADGSWVFQDAALKGEPEGASFRVVLGGKNYSPAWVHSHNHDGDGHEGHDHDGEDHEDHDEMDSDG